MAWNVERCAMWKGRVWARYVTVEVALCECECDKWWDVEKVLVY